MKRNPVLILNPKCATTSLRNALNIRPPRTHHIHLALDHPRMVQHLNQTRNAWVGMPVRNPLDRAVSCYHFWRKSRNRSVRENDVLEVFAQGLTCSQFWEVINIEKLARTVPHFRTQLSFLGAERKVDQIIRFEFLQLDFVEYCNGLGIQAPELPHKFKTNHRSPEEELSPEALRKVCQFYACDFKAFGYETPKV